MAKNNNLTDFLTNTAAAIREVEGSTDPINPQDFEAKIKALKQSGGAAEGDITFYDYDGTIVTSWSLDKLSTATSLPNLPEHDGLICEGWNWTLEDLQATNRKMDVGAMYITDDGKTRLYITIASKGRMDVPLNFLSRNVVIDWGDGSAIETANSYQITHNYTSPDDYIITLESSDGSPILLGNRIDTLAAIDRADSVAYRNMLKKVELGALVNIEGAFLNCACLKTITMPSTLDTPSWALYQTFDNCSSLLSIVIPPNVVSSTNSFTNCYSLSKLILPGSAQHAPKCEGCYTLRNITLPNGITKLIGNAFKGCESLSSIELPDNCTSMGEYAFYGCYSLQSIALPANIDIYSCRWAFRSCKSLSEVIFKGSAKAHTLGQYVFSDCPVLSSITLPSDIHDIFGYAFSNCVSLTEVKMLSNSTLSSIDNYAFNNCNSMKIYDFSKMQRPPTLKGTNSLTVPEGCKILINKMYASHWLSDTNWSAYADYMVQV
jgi:hypothetical protein